MLPYVMVENIGGLIFLRLLNTAEAKLLRSKINCDKDSQRLMDQVFYVDITSFSQSAGVRKGGGIIPSPGS